jgi:hypothetical protein
MTTKPQGFQPTSKRQGMLRPMWGGAAGASGAPASSLRGINHTRPDPDHVRPADYVHRATTK